MGLASDCYNPGAFTEKGELLLSVGQWQMVQLYLVDAMNLHAPGGGPPPGDVAGIYASLASEAERFRGEVLPRAQGLGGRLEVFGGEAATIFGRVISLMEASPVPKTAIVQMLSDLRGQAEECRAEASEIQAAVDRFTAATREGREALVAAMERENAAIGHDRLEIERLQAQYQSRYADKQQAQARIVSDRKVIDSTKYYSWIPFVGTSVGVGEIVSKKKDIEKQVDRIREDVREMERLQGEIRNLNREIPQLTYTVQYNGHLAEELERVLSAMQPVRGAWQTIVNELGDVIGNIEGAAAAELKDQPCLAAAVLAAAADEWRDVAADARNFSRNFYIRQEGLSAA